MEKRAFVVTGLGYGDEGKWTTTHWLCVRHKVHTVIRTGGPQAFHRVVTADGREHVHSQFGSGTLAGAATHLSSRMVIDPDAILREGEALKYEHGIGNIFDYMTVHEDALVVTPFDAIANRLRELARGADRHGTVGIGVGEAVLGAEALELAALRVKDIGKPYLKDKLELIRVRKAEALSEIRGALDALPEDVRTQACEELARLCLQGTLDWMVERSRELISRVRVVDTGYVAEKILGRPGTVVCEGSQGVLLDRWYGFHPYTTKVRTIPQTGFLMAECGYNGRIVSLGVLRGYHTRHGAGPFVSESAELTEKLPDSNNGTHPWQGNFRVGALDMVVVKYAVDACGGSEALNGLVITCMDRMAVLGAWNLCTSYTGPDGSNNFTYGRGGCIDGIVVCHGKGADQLDRQEKLGRELRKCAPQVTTLKIASGNHPYLIGLSQSVGDVVNVPVVAVSFGPTEADKVVVA